MLCKLLLGRAPGTGAWLAWLGFVCPIEVPDVMSESCGVTKCFLSFFLSEGHNTVRKNFEGFHAACFLLEHGLQAVLVFSVFFLQCYIV